MAKVLVNGLADALGISRFTYVGHSFGGVVGFELGLSYPERLAYAKRQRLGEIETPTLVIAGAADALLATNLEDFSRLGNATLHVFSRVSHPIHREVPREFATVLADFLEHGVVRA